MPQTPAPAAPGDALTVEKALEESLAAYQRGTELLKFCESRLTDAQARIAILEGGALRDFTPGEK